MTEITFRYRIWDYCAGHLAEGCVLPKWAIALRLILFPRFTAGALLLRAHPFNPLDMTWTIYGTQFSDELMATLAGQMGSDWFRVIRRSDGLVTLEKRYATEAND